VSGGIAQLFLILVTRSGEWSASGPGRLYTQERPGTHCTGGWVGPGAGLDMCGKSRHTGIFFYVTLFILLDIHVEPVLSYKSMQGFSAEQF
jgi:hypothetical protein